MVWLTIIGNSYSVLESLLVATNSCIAYVKARIHTLHPDPASC